MKNSKYLILIGGILLIWPIFLFPVNRENEAETNTLNQENVLDQEIKEDVKKPPKSSGYTHYREWIHIDGSDPTNWSNTASTYDWCYKESYYYVIENVTIDGTNPMNGVGILIENSIEYFVIRNCTILDCEEGSQYDAGIKLEQTTNGTIVDNEINENYIGVYLDHHCKNITISNNDLLGNKGYGIYLRVACNENVIFNNTIDEYGGISTFAGIYIFTSCYNNKILNNTINNCYWSGIYICVHSDGTIIANNTLDSNQENGIHISQSDNIQLLNNKLDSNRKDGIYIYQSKGAVLLNNTINNCAMSGISLIGDSDDAIIANNTLDSNQDSGIYISDSNNTALLNNKMKKCSIYLTGGRETTHTISINNNVNGKPVYYYKNEDNLNTDNFTYAGDPGEILLAKCNYSVITGFNISYGSIGISLTESENNTISNNTLNSHGLFGIYFNRFCDNNTIFNNTIDGKNSCYKGIILDSYCDDNNITSNTIKRCNWGIELLGSEYNNVTYNNLRDNNENGIIVSTYSDHNFIFNNTIDNSIIYYGIFIEYHSHNNTILNNTILNSGYGIYLRNNCNDTDIIGNLIKNNIQIGIYIDDATGDNCGKNNITQNLFIGNGQHAQDDHSGLNPNDWDGNYWDDYTGVDADDDAIGDTPYIIPGTAGSQDSLPIWWDAPVLNITVPMMDQNLGSTAPIFNISVVQGLGDYFWCELLGTGKIMNLTKLNGVFNENISISIIRTLWSSLPYGNVTFRFYCNDTQGYVGFIDFYVIKEAPPPPPPSVGDDDDDDDDDTGAMVVLVVVVVVACVGAGVVVLIILIKKEIIMAPKSR